MSVAMACGPPPREAPEELLPAAYVTGPARELRDRTGAWLRALVSMLPVPVAELSRARLMLCQLPVVAGACHRAGFRGA